MSPPVLRALPGGAGVATSGPLVSVSVGTRKLGAREPVQLATPSTRVHDVSTMVAQIREAIVTACKPHEGVAMAWMADDGSEFVITGTMGLWQGCEVAADISEAVTVTVGGESGPWIQGLFLPLPSAMKAGFRQIWRR